MADTDPPSAGEVKAVVTRTADDVLHFVEVLCEWLVPVIGIILGLFIGPKLFTGGAIGDALWNLGLTSGGGAGGSYASLIGTLAGAGIVGVAAASLWTYQEGRKGWTALISRAFAGFTIGWSLGILVLGLNAFFITGITPGNLIDGWLDGAINTFALKARASVPTPPTPS